MFHTVDGCPANQVNSTWFRLMYIHSTIDLIEGITGLFWRLDYSRPPKVKSGDSTLHLPTVATRVVYDLVHI